MRSAERPIRSSPAARAWAPPASPTSPGTSRPSADRESFPMWPTGSAGWPRNTIPAAATRERSDMASPADAQSGRLLVVDDNRVNRLLLGRALEQLGHTVTFAENGREALAALGRRRADLILLDIEMPEMDGYQVLAALAADPRLRGVPVGLMSPGVEGE